MSALTHNRLVSDSVLWVMLHKNDAPASRIPSLNVQFVYIGVTVAPICFLLVVIHLYVICNFQALCRTSVREEGAGGWCRRGDGEGCRVMALVITTVRFKSLVKLLLFCFVVVVTDWPTCDTACLHCCPPFD